eukprot:52593-Pleurochrysis_carterae.AAC.1
MRERVHERACGALRWLTCVRSPAGLCEPAADAPERLRSQRVALGSVEGALVRSAPRSPCLPTRPHQLGCHSRLLSLVA